VCQGDATYLITKEDNTLEDFGVNAVCTHLGCVVPWNKSANKFCCPCHGSQYDKNGKVWSLWDAHEDFKCGVPAVSRTLREQRVVLVQGGPIPSFAREGWAVDYRCCGRRKVSRHKNEGSSRYSVHRLLLVPPVCTGCRSWGRCKRTGCCTENLCVLSTR